MKPIKLAAIVAASILGLLVVAIVAILLLVDPNRHRATIEAQVQQLTGRPFAIAGTMKLSLFPWIALDVGRVSLGNPAGFGAEPALVAERTRVGAKLLPLLAGRLEISRVALDGLEISVVRHADGHHNWEMPAKSTPNAPTGSAGRSASSLSVEGIDVIRASLTVRDEGASAVTRVRELEFHSGALGRGSATDLTLAARVDAGEGTPVLAVKLATQATVDGDRSRATLAGLKISGERTAPGGRALPFSFESPQVALDWKAGTVEPAKATLRLGDVRIEAELDAGHWSEPRALDARLRLPEFSPRATLPTLGITLPAMRATDALDKLAGSLALHVRGDSLTIDPLDLTLDTSHLRGRLGRSGGPDPRLEADLSIDAIDVDRYRAPDAAANKTAAPTKPEELPVATLRALNAIGKLTIGRATVAALPLTDVRLDFTAAKGEIHAAPSARAFGGVADLDVRLDAARDVPALALAANVRDIDVGAAVKAYAKSDRLSGRALAAAKLGGAGRTSAALVDALSGPIDVEVHNGALEGIDLAYELERAEAVLSRQVPAPRSGPERTPFTVLNAHSNLKGGVLATDPLRIETPVLKVAGKGTFQLSDQSVDYQITTVLQQAPASAPALRGLEIPVAVTGTVRDYKVRPDLGGVAKARLKQELDKHKDQLRDAVTDKLKDLFKH
ncbi:MAG: AsmA family protein [Proteobacteria bacterium]|nr:AsmA family protein [Pseudomonadota bacterium]